MLRCVNFSILINGLLRAAPCMAPEKGNFARMRGVVLI